MEELDQLDLWKALVDSGMELIKGEKENSKILGHGNSWIGGFKYLSRVIIGCSSVICIISGWRLRLQTRGPPL